MSGNGKSLGSRTTSQKIPRYTQRIARYLAIPNCPYCGTPIQPNDPSTSDIDHILPKKLGGDHRLANLEVTCPHCNRSLGSDLNDHKVKQLAAHEKAILRSKNKFEKPIEIIDQLKLRVPQREGYEAILNHFNSGNRSPALLELPTGSGKTLLLAMAPYGVAKGPVLVIAPNLEIRSQITEKLGGTETELSYYEYFNLIRPELYPRIIEYCGLTNFYDLKEADIVVANIQQLAGPRSEIFSQEDFECIIVDEAHHVPAKTWRELLDRFSASVQIFLTATPYRYDRLPIKAERIYSYSLAEAIKKKYIRNIQFVETKCSKVTIDNWEPNGDARTFNEMEISEMRDNHRFSSALSRSSEVARDIIEKAILVWREKRVASKERHSLLICGRRIDQIENLVVEVEKKGLKAKAIHSQMPSFEVHKILDEFHDGKIDALLHAGMLGEGYDEKSISVVALIRNFRSFPCYYQMVGRSLRFPETSTTPADMCAVIVDHIGFNHEACIQWMKGEMRAAEQIQDFDEDSEEDDDEEEKRGSKSSIIDRTVPIVIDYEVSGFSEEFLVDPNEMRDIVQAREKVGEVSDPALRQQLQKVIEENQNQRKSKEPMQRPDLIHKKAEQKLDAKIKRVAGRVLGHMELESSGTELICLEDAIDGKRPSKNNYQVIIRSINRKLRKEINIPDGLKERARWSLQSIQEAGKKYLLVANEILQELCQNLSYSEPYPSLEPPDKYDEEEEEV